MPSLKSQRKSHFRCLIEPTVVPSDLVLKCLQGVTGGDTCLLAVGCQTARVVLSGRGGNGGGSGSGGRSSGCGRRSGLLCGSRRGGLDISSCLQHRGNKGTDSSSSGEVVGSSLASGGRGSRRSGGAGGAGASRSRPNSTSLTTLPHDPLAS